MYDTWDSMSAQQHQRVADAFYDVAFAYLQTGREQDRIVAAAWQVSAAREYAAARRKLGIE